MTESLKIRLLGSPQVTLGNEALTDCLSTKGQALLFYLAATGDVHPRDVVASLFWQDMPDAQAKKNLRNVLPQLRKYVGPYLTITRQVIGFNRDSSYWLDMDVLSGLFASTTSEAGVPELSQATALYRGNFLDGFYVQDAPAFEEWMLTEREHLRELAIRGLTMLADQYIQQDDIEAGLTTTQRLLALEPWHETAHRQQMLLLVLHGDNGAALAQYEKCRQILANEFGVEPNGETTALYERVKAGHIEATTRRQEPTSSLPMERGVIEISDSVTPSSANLVAPSPQPQVNWSNIPQVPNFAGREHEFQELTAWVANDGCRLVAIVGIGGQGKTALAAQFVRSLTAQNVRGKVGNPIVTDSALQPATLSGFERIIWRSLLNAPPLPQIMQSWLQLLSGQQLTKLPDNQDEQFSLLMEMLHQQRCLLVLDNAESIMEHGERAGHYRLGYEMYGELLRRMAEVEHRSCLLLTSRERPHRIGRFAATSSAVRVLQLDGVSDEAAIQLLHTQGLHGTESQMASLVRHYSGNPLALLLVSHTIEELYFDDPEVFLDEGVPIFDDIRDVLDQQFNRLTDVEQAIMFWLAIEREPTTAKGLWENLAPPPARRVFMEALRSLQRRSLIDNVESVPGRDVNGARFALQNVITEYVADILVDKVCRELDAGDLELFNRHALMKAQSYEYVRENQKRLILEPVAQQIISQHGRQGAIQRLERSLDSLRSKTPHVLGYAGTNLLHLFLHLQVDLRNADFSNLNIWQADLRNVALPDVNFAQSDLSHSLFTDTLAQVYAVAFSPDGTLLAASTMTGEIHLWDVASGHSCARWQASEAGCLRLVFSPDGRSMASSDVDGQVYLWNMTNVTQLGRGKLCIKWQAHTDSVWALAFHSDGDLLASGSADHRICIWDAKRGQSIGTLPEHISQVYSIAFHPNRRILASAGGKGMIDLWDLRDHSILQKSDELDLIVSQPSLSLEGHETGCYAIAFSPDGQTLVSGGSDGTVHLWDLNQGKRLQTLEGHGNEVWAVAFSPDGKIIASAGGDATIRLWDRQSGQCLHVVQGHIGLVQTVAFSPSGQILASGGMDQSVRLWNPHTGLPRQALHGNAAKVYTTTFSPNGQSLASAGNDPNIRLWDVQTGQQQRILEGHTKPVISLAFDPNGHTLASACGDHTARVWDVATGRIRHILSGHSAGVTGVTFSHDGQILASSSTDQTVRLWSVTTGQLRHILEAHTSLVQSVAFSPLKNLLASAGYDEAVYLWDGATGKRYGELPNNTEGMQRIAFRPDGTLLAAACCDSNIRLWDVRDPQRGKLQLTLRGHTGEVYALAFSPDGRVLASGAMDREIRLWDVCSGDLISVLKQCHLGIVASVSFHPDGQTLVSNGIDEDIKFWDVKTGQCINVLRPKPPYAGMNITGVTGISEVQRATLKALGAVEA